MEAREPVGMDLPSWAASLHVYPMDRR